MLILGLLTGGIAMNKRLAVTNGVREGSRYGATLAVASAPSCASGGMTCWLSSVATIAQQGSEGELAGTVPSSIVCVAYVYPNGTTAIDRTSRMTRTAGVDGALTTGSPCFSDGRPDSERRVQVVGQRAGKIEYLLGSSTLILSSRSVTRFEAA
jgi:hypothetical protein